MTQQVLIAGVGNIFLRDDGFGSEVAQRLATRPLPDGVRVVDYGIGGIHLAYDLLAGVDQLILVDALPRDLAPGTVSLLEVQADQDLLSTVDSHAMDPATVFASLRGLGGLPPPTVVVGCEPADLSEGMGLTPQVAAAVDPTVKQVLQLAAERAGGVGAQTPKAAEGR
ncbi:MAG TPA: hydrogenase maturation protease [Euzebyales bacterium]|nr:hydrogenase maturation protease [Euzebyales bacterium]